jgi:hypothetical protein
MVEVIFPKVTGRSVLRNGMERRRLLTMVSTRIIGTSPSHIGGRIIATSGRPTLAKAVFGKTASNATRNNTRATSLPHSLQFLSAMGSNTSAKQIYRVKLAILSLQDGCETAIMTIMS